MIIGQFNESFPPITDGVAQVVKNYAYWQNKKDDTCYVITPKVPGENYDYSFKVLAYNSFKIPSKRHYRTGIPRFDRTFYKELKKIKFDIIHAHSPFSSGELGRKIASELNIPIVATFHSKFKEDFKQYVKSDIIADYMTKKVISFFNKVDEVWTVNDSAVKTLREYGFKKDVHVMNNACDITPEPKSEQVNKLVNKKFNLPAETPLFVFVGQHIWQKNIKMIIDSLKILNDMNIDFRMLFIGDGDKKTQAESIVKDYGLSDKVKFTGIIHNRETIKNIFLRSTAMLFPSLYDMSSLVVKEAAAMKCPSVLVKKSTTSQGVKDEYNGFLVENNASSLAKKVIKIINTKKLTNKVGENALKTLYVSWEDTCKMAKERYKYLIQNYNKDTYDTNNEQNYA